MNVLVTIFSVDCTKPNKNNFINVLTRADLHMTAAYGKSDTGYRPPPANYSNCVTRFPSHRDWIVKQKVSLFFLINRFI